MEKKFRKKIVFWIIVAGSTLIVFTFLIGKTNNNKTATNRIEDKLKETFGWTEEEFVEWAYKVKPIKEHKRWKIWKDGNKELMEPNEPFLTAILNDANDVPLIYPEYQYEWEFELPNELPNPVIKVLKSVTYFDVNDVIGKNIRDIFLCLEGPLVDICAHKNGKIMSSEPIEVKLSFLSENKLNFFVKTEPFILSDNPDVHGRIKGRLVLYVLRGLDVKLGYKFRQQFIGENDTVLLENNNGQVCGRSERYFMVQLKKTKKKLKKNELVGVKLIENKEDGMSGQVNERGLTVAV